MLFNNLTKLSRVQYFKNCDYGGGGMSILLIFLMEVEEFALFFLLCQGIFQKSFLILRRNIIICS